MILKWFTTDEYDKYITKIRSDLDDYMGTITTYEEDNKEGNDHSGINFIIVATGNTEMDTIPFVFESEEDFLQFQLKYL